MLKKEFRLSIFSSLSKSGFSMDELLLETKRLFDTEGIVGFLRVLLEMMDQIVVGLCNNDCCKKFKAELNRKELKQIHTSCGFLKFNWTRVRCAHCGKSFVPLKKFLGLENHQPKTSELEKIVAETVSEQSYRRSKQHLETIGSVAVPHTTIHRWVMKSSCDEIDLNKRVDTLMADGTGYKGHPLLVDSERPEVKIVIGITGDKVVPYGAFTEDSWVKIKNKLKKANHPSDKIKFKPIAKLLVSDGEEGIINHLGKLTENTQRCTWHLPHDLYPLLRYQESVPADEASILTSELCGIINIEMPKEDYEKVKLEEKLELEKRIWTAEEELKKLVAHLKEKGYRKAATYIENSRDKIFSYLKFWLKTGVIHPRVTSMLERMMREIGRRIKKIGHNFSPKGAQKLTNIIIKRITSANEWVQYWNEKLNIRGDVKLTFGGCEIA